MIRLVILLTVFTACDRRSLDTVVLNEPVHTSVGHVRTVIDQSTKTVYPAPMEADCRRYTQQSEDALHTFEQDPTDFNKELMAAAHTALLDECVQHRVTLSALIDRAASRVEEIPDPEARARGRRLIGKLRAQIVYQQYQSRGAVGLGAVFLGAAARTQSQANWARHPALLAAVGAVMTLQLLLTQEDGDAVRGLQLDIMVTAGELMALESDTLHMEIIDMSDEDEIIATIERLAGVQIPQKDRVCHIHRMKCKFTAGDRPMNISTCEGCFQHCMGTGVWPNHFHAGASVGTCNYWDHTWRVLDNMPKLPKPPGS